MQYDELLDYLQNLTQRKITQQEIGEALNVSKQAIGKKKASGYEFKNFEIEKIKNVLLNNICDKNSTKVDNGLLKYDIIEIPYWHSFPEEMKNPQYPFVIAQRCSIASWSKGPQNLCIIAMNGDKLENYWYKIRNNDVLIIDLNETKVNANGSGVYFATSRNNSMYWVREMQALYNGDIEFNSYAPSGHDTRILTLEQLQDADFKVIGKVIKNVSFTL